MPGMEPIEGESSRSGVESLGKTPPTQHNASAGSSQNESSSDRIYDTTGDRTSLSTRKRGRAQDQDIQDSESTRRNVGDGTRAERKRHREQQRRGNVNKGLDDLMELLMRIDPNLNREAVERSRHPVASGEWTSLAGLKSTGESHTGMSRVEIVQNALYTLERIHHENEERKLVINDLMRNNRVTGLRQGFLGGMYDLVPASLLQQRTTSLAQHSPLLIQQNMDAGRLYTAAEVNRAMAYGGSYARDSSFPSQHPIGLPPRRDILYRTDSPLFAQAPQVEPSSSRSSLSLAPGDRNDSDSSHRAFLRPEGFPGVSGAFAGLHFGGPSSSIGPPAHVRRSSMETVLPSASVDTSRPPARYAYWDREVSSSATDPDREKDQRKSSGRGSVT